MDIKTIKTIESATEKSISSFAKLSLSLLFLLAVFLWTYSSHGKVPDNTFFNNWCYFWGLHGFKYWSK